MVCSTPPAAEPSAWTTSRPTASTHPTAQFEVCSITKEEALKMFEKYLTTHDPCVWAKHNAPFMCTKQGPPAPSAVFSLAYANALLAYSISVSYTHLTLPTICSV